MLILRVLFFVLLLISELAADSGYFRPALQGLKGLRNIGLGQTQYLSIKTPSGKIHFWLTLNEIDESDDLKLFTGKVRKNLSLQAVSASIIDNELRINLPGKRGHYYLLRKDLNYPGKLVRLTHIPAKIDFACGEFHLDSFSQELREDLQGAAFFEPGYTISIGLDADYQFLKKYKFREKKVRALQRNYLNGVNAIYQEQLGIKLKQASRHVFTEPAPFKSTRDADKILTKFRKYTNRNKQIRGKIRHLLTGKNIHFSSSTGVVGLAYIGTVCSNKKYTYGITEARPALASVIHLIMAHEIAHNFGATHDFSAPGIMSPSLNVNFPNFSTASINQIASHVSLHNSCLKITE